jgi:hypothetical protein
MVVLLGLGLLVVGIPFAPWSLALVALVPLAASAVALWRRRLDRRAWIVAGWWTAGFAALCPVLTDLNLVLMTHDSHIFVIFGRTIAHRGELPPDLFAMLDEWGVFQVVAQSLVTLTTVDFLYALPLFLGLSFVPVFALSLWHGLGAHGAPVARRALLVALATVALFTNAMILFHVAYLHSNMGTAVYLFGFVVLFWLAEVEDDPSYLPVAFLCLIALALQRTETPIVALLFLALTVPQSALPRAALTRGMIEFTVVVGLWFEVLAHHVTTETAFLTPTRCRIIWGALVLGLGWWLLSDRPFLRKLNRVLPFVIAGLAAAALAAAFAAEPGHMWLSFGRWTDALLDVPHWGSFWTLVPLLALVALLAPAPRFRHVFVIGIPVFFAFVLLLALGRDPYFTRVDDSANRMTIHVVPLLVWYLALKVLPLAAPRAEPS